MPEESEVAKVEAENETEQQAAAEPRRGRGRPRKQTGPTLTMDIEGFTDDEHRMRKGNPVDVIKTYETGHVRVKTAAGHQLVLGPEAVAE